MSVLLAHLLKWQFQPDRRCKSWERTIISQRNAMAEHLMEVPSLKPKLDDVRWMKKVWDDAVAIAAQEAGLSDFPDYIPWQVGDVLKGDWLP